VVTGIEAVEVQLHARHFLLPVGFERLRRLVAGAGLALLREQPGEVGPRRQFGRLLANLRGEGRYVGAEAVVDTLGDRLDSTAKQFQVVSSTRARLRAELDGIIAHVYELTEEEFAYILTTFPFVPDPVKIAARNAYRDVERGLIK